MLTIPKILIHSHTHTHLHFHFKSHLLLVPSTRSLLCVTFIFRVVFVCFYLVSHWHNRCQLILLLFKFIMTLCHYSSGWCRHSLPILSIRWIPWKWQCISWSSLAIDWQWWSPTNMPTYMSLKAVMHTVDAIHMFHATCNGPMPIHYIFYTFRAISRPIHQGEALDFVQSISIWTHTQTTFNQFKVIDCLVTCI